MQVRRVSARKASAAFLTVLVLALLSSIQIAYAWNPTASDLTGTSSSTDNSVADALRRFDIDHTTAGIQTGEDTDSLAFLIKLQASQLLQSSPTADSSKAPIVTNPTFAYNSNPDDAATFPTSSNNGLWTITSFETGSGTIVSVDLYVRASATGDTDDTYGLTYTTGGTETTLWAPSTAALPLLDHSFLSLVEPNDGTWSWTDVDTLLINWLSNKVGGYTGAIVSVYEVWLIVKGYGFDATAMTANDQYEIDFTIGEEDFAMLFQATGAAAGTMKLFYRATGGGAWSNGETYVVGSITSGTAYQSVSTNLGFTLTSSTATVGSAKLVVKKTYLATLGATANAVSGIFAANFAGGTGEAGSGGATPNDLSPSSGGASWTLSEAIPDFPHGTLVLMAPVISAYLVLRKRNGAGDT
ncbi:MAG: hypothetical protein NWE88_03015 [Candidatus Bathyarchaeota archaeon]|nr:hypothetical protein [Candidatus Bathyarchaeota archaeon]